MIPTPAIRANHQPVAITIHGFANRNGLETTDRLRPYLEVLGFEVVEWDYEWQGIIGVHLGDTAIAHGLAQFARYVGQYRPVVVLGHSNGDTIIHRATLPFPGDLDMETSGAYFDRVILLDPALDKNAVFGRIGGGTVYYTPWDWIVRLSKIAFGQWGSMGAEGPQKDAQLGKVDMSQDAVCPIKSAVFSHDEIFKHLDYWGPVIAKDAMAFRADSEKGE